MMKIGGRVGFDRVEDLEELFKSIDFPIELALPWKYRDLWLPVEGKVNQIIDFLKEKDIAILSIHAPQGKITEDSFLRWGQLTIEIAQSLGVDNITIHPNNVKGQKAWHQEKTLRYIKRLGGDNIFSIETFGGKTRVFSPAELVRRKIPMTLDTAHIRDRREVMNIVINNQHNIKTVHLSSIDKDEHHLPIDDFCLKAVDKLIELKWSGNIILEYLPWHHYRIREDLRALSDYIASGGSASGCSLRLLPLSDQFKGDPMDYGYNIDGT